MIPCLMQSWRISARVGAAGAAPWGSMNLVFEAVNNKKTARSEIPALLPGLFQEVLPRMS